MNSPALFAILLGYFGLLFAFAWWAERKAPIAWVQNRWVYALALGVYCTAWTYYGSIGVAAKQGYQFLAIYLGPVISMPLWVWVMQKLVRISHKHKITSIADFISVRYGNRRSLGAWVTFVCLLAVIPYISLQLKAVSESFSLLVANGAELTGSVFRDKTLYLALLIALFAAFFGTRTADVSLRRRGIMAAIALESVVKLLIFLLAGGVVVFGIFGGTQELSTLIKARSEPIPAFDFRGPMDGVEWGATIGLSFLAIFLLPRQFHVAVVENREEGNIRTASWFFPLYLLLFNLLVVFIAWVGLVRFGGEVNPDYYILMLPLIEGYNWLAVLVFIGGFSAVLSMIVVSTLSLSTMLSNSLILPYGLLKSWKSAGSDTNQKKLKNLRRLLIFSLILLAYVFYIQFSTELSLYSIGLVSFVVIAQLAPSLFLGLIWSRGSSSGAQYGMVTGMIVLGYTLFYPAFLSLEGEALTSAGIWNPHALLGIHGLSPEIHALFWSLSVNTLLFLGVSLKNIANYRERNYAELFINEEKYEHLAEDALIWKGEAYVSDIEHLLSRFLGEERTRRAMNIFNRKYGVERSEGLADPRLVSFSERLLSGSLGPSSARVLLTAITKEQPVSTAELFKVLEETRQTRATNRQLREESDELQKLTLQLRELNQELIAQDKRKDEFLETVAHELRTPVTSIQTATEILEDPDMPAEDRVRFLRNIQRETDRLGRLIHHILDLEKLSSGRGNLKVERQDLIPVIRRSLQNVTPLAAKKGIRLEWESGPTCFALFDADRIAQVLTNLLSNALKFTEEQSGWIRVEVLEDQEGVQVVVTDNGRGFHEEDRPYIFDKFYQSKNQNTLKPSGSGFGLAICRTIVEGHGGEIWLDSSYREGACFVFRIPLT